MMISGFVLFISPPGRIANWSDWHLLGFTKREWQNQHVVFGSGFILFSIFHLCVFNWKAFFSYLTSRAAHGLNNPAEITASVVLSVLLAVGTLYHSPPFAQLIELGDRLSGSWEKRSGTPPVPHAETFSLKELGRLPQVSVAGDEIVNRLHSAGIRVRNAEQTLQQIAAENRMEVQKLYVIMATDHSASVFTSRTGWGQRTLREAADSTGVTPLALQQALKQQGVTATPDEKIQEIARKHGMKAAELVRKIETITEKR
jgi:hypothetical protein